VVTPGGTLVAGPLGPEATAVAEQVAAERGARLVRDIAVIGDGPFEVETPAGRYAGIELRALGRFQRANFALAVAAAEAFLGSPLDLAAVRTAARELVLPGRLEIVDERPLVVIDGAHNPSGASALADSLPAVVGDRRLIGVISVLEDKDAAGILAALQPLLRGAVFTRSERAGALPPAVLESLWGQVGGSGGEVVANPAEAVTAAKRRAGPDGAVLVTGSIYLLAELTRRSVLLRPARAAR